MTSKLSVQVLALLAILLVVARFSCGTESMNKYGNNTAQHSNQEIKNLKHRVGAPRFKNDATRPALIISIALVAIASIFSNSLIIHVIRVNKHMRTTTNYFIVSMAFGDMMATIAFAPGAIIEINIGMEWSEGIFGLITCKALHFPMYVAMYCSAFSLLAITFDRFMAVSRPLTYKYHSRWTKYIIPIVWITSLVIPYLLGFKSITLQRYEILQSNKTYCFPPDPTTKCLIFSSIGFLLPMVAMVTLYAMISYKLWTRKVPGDKRDAERRNVARQTAKKVTLMIVCILLAFEFCWAPKYTLWVIHYFLSRLKYSADYDFFQLISGIFMISNGLFNALIYGTFNENYRQAFKKSVLGWKRIDLQSINTRNAFNTRKT